MNKTYEPVLIRAAVVAVLTAILHALVVTGKLPLEPEAEDAFAGIIDALGLTVAAFWARSGVVPVAKIEDALASSSEEVIVDKAGEQDKTLTNLPTIH